MATIKPLDFGYGPSNENIFAAAPSQWINNIVLLANTPKSIVLGSLVGRIIILSWPGGIDLYYACQTAQPTWPVAADNANGTGWGVNPGPLYIKEADAANLWIVSDVAALIAVAHYKRTS